MNLQGRIAARLDRIAGVEICRILFYALHSDSAVAPQPPGGVRIARLTHAGAGELARAPLAEPQLALERMRNGDVCYVAYLGDNLVHHSWARRSGIQTVPEAGFDLVVRPGEFWIYHCWTAAEARGRRIYPEVLRQITADHFGEGFSVARIYTTGRNIASQRGIMAAGFRFEQACRALRIGPWVRALGSRPSAA